LAALKPPDPPSSDDEEDDDDSSEEEIDVGVDLSLYKYEDPKEYKQRIFEDASEEEIQFSSDDEEEFEINFALESKITFNTRIYY